MCLISLGQRSEEDGEELARFIPGKFLAYLEWIIFFYINSIFRDMKIAYYEILFRMVRQSQNTISCMHKN